MAELLSRKTVSDLKASTLRDLFLIGLHPYLVDPTTQEPFPDEWYNHFIMSAIEKFEEYTQVHVNPKEIIAEKHDYHLNDYANFAFIELFQAPILEMTKIEVIYPTNVAATEFPVEWAKIQGTHTIQLVPTSGTLAQIILGKGGAYLPLIYEGGLGFLPQLFHISYMVGFHRDMIPYSIFNAILKLAGIEVLTQASDLIYGPGVQNVSTGFDGISMSRGISNPLFASRIEGWRKELYGNPPMSASQSGALDKIRNIYHGIMMRVA